MPNYIGTWVGGRIHQAKDGRRTFVIRRSVGGKRYVVSLHVHTEGDALAELALFNRDPEGYAAANRVRGYEPAKAKPHLIEDAAVLGSEAFTRLAAQQRKEGLTENHIRCVRHYLNEWAAQLGTRPLDTVNGQEMKALLLRWPTARRNRIVAIKSLCTFLEEEGTLDPAKNPARLIKTPPPRPEKAIRRKGYTFEHVETIYGAIYPWRSVSRPVNMESIQAVRDVLCIQAKTGMHGTEIDRMARGGGTLRPVKHPVIAGTVRFVHKIGRVHTVSLDAQAFAAAKRLQARGRAPVLDWVRQVVGRAAASVGREPINFGELRHSFTSWAKTHGQVVRPNADAGVPLEAIAAVLGHTTTRTTTLFYLTEDVPPLIALPLKLEHPDDPAPRESSSVA